MSQDKTNMLLNAEQVLERCGYRSRSSLYRLVRQQRLPAPVSVGGNQIRWRSVDIEQWLSQLPTRSY